MEHHQQFPDLSKASEICLDLETHDPELKTRGCGGVRGSGYPLGFALAWRDTDRSVFGLSPGVKSIYLPISHAYGNLDPDQVKLYLNDTFSRNIPVIGANIAYDLEWCKAAGIRVTGLKLDVQVAEALIDENQKSYRLNALAKKYLGEEKLTDEMGVAGAAHLGCKPEEVITRLRELPASMVADYARTDAELTLEIMEIQQRSLFELGLQRVWDLECRLVDTLLEMRFKGIRLDVEGTRILQTNLAEEEQYHRDEIKKMVGWDVNPWSNDDVCKAAHQLGLTGLVV
ncbi:MAG: hypothetical protein MN733_28645 [Nitrososphaera sp.]|nr:hypothetical protein [Nitrososphaera sp.]